MLNGSSARTIVDFAQNINTVYECVCMLCMIGLLVNEPPRGKTNNVVSEQI